ncbi:sensor histidine kinase [Anaerocolumna sp. MB42-C2]|uniref:sensor histidine kinase n=1 Tax=Anaerocolumna sp. MB42-C2 TaxID=3070997 RepID=UPI0027DF6F2D|nr:HAMP domain-containing sensor histidine kinase [Anaerocolumna sp. MB42-C2]WMJ85549.1 HAMP domain-containing sensor histidine kinase [Anaerocolumna sp. MB42-C2]
MSRLSASIREIATRSYLPIQAHGAFRDIYDSLNTLDTEIKASDRLREQTEKMRKEWIANITHDLKTPLSPIKGYAEILQEHSTKTEEQCKRYAHIMLKNVSYMETLIDDLKLTYQLENGLIPLKRQEQNFIRFIKELIIDILNNPEYARHTIHFDASEETVLISFDQTLLIRAFQNLIINAFLHGNENTELTLQISVADTMLKIVVSDNGKGMTAEETGSLFQRYYRGTTTEHKPEGTGLGLAITKSIVELHGGTISVSSIPGIGTAFQIQFPVN